MNIQKGREIENFVLECFYNAGQASRGENLLGAEKRVNEVLRIMFHYEELALAQKMRKTIAANLATSKIYYGDRFRSFCIKETFNEALIEYKENFELVVDKIIEKQKRKA